MLGWAGEQEEESKAAEGLSVFISVGSLRG